MSDCSEIVYVINDSEITSVKIRYNRNFWNEILHEIILYANTFIFK